MSERLADTENHASNQILEVGNEVQRSILITKLVMGDVLWIDDQWLIKSPVAHEKEHKKLECKLNDHTAKNRSKYWK